MTIEVALLVSFLSAAFSIYFGLKNSRHTDTEDIERRAAESAKTNAKLDSISSTVNDIKYDITATRKDVQALNERLVETEASCKSAHKRIDRLERRDDRHEE
jgi:septal ring factor EnvC (AmiA/AmiB activator)